MLTQYDHIMCTFPWDQSLPILKADYSKHSFSIFRTIPSVFKELGGCCYFSAKLGGWILSFFGKKINFCKMLRQENRKFAFLDSYHKRKKSFGFVLKNAPRFILIILHISVSINQGYVQQVHKAKDICIPAWLLPCLKCWQSHGSSDHTQTPKSIKTSFNSYWILLEQFPNPPFFFLNIWVFTYTAVLPAQQQYLPRILNSILNILSINL